MSTPLKWLDSVPWSIVVIAALVLGPAPFAPEPHLVQKLRMLAAGTLHRPIDIFDLFYHATPILLLILKTLRALQLKIYSRR